MKSLSSWHTKYRIVIDNYLGYQVEVWKVWFPIWLQLDGVNTFSSVTDATNFAEQYVNGTKTNIVKYL